MFRELRDWAVYTNVFLAVGAGFMAYATCVFLAVEPYPAILAILFLGTFAIYTTNRFTDLDEDRLSHPVRYSFVMRHKHALLALAGSSYVAALAVALTGGLQTVWVVMLPAVLALLYNVKWMPALPVSRLKEITGVKNTTVALAWAIGTVFVPVFYVSRSPGFSAWVAFGYTFLMCFINTVLFDIRDVRGDAHYGIGTIPVTLGVSRTKRLLLLLNGLLAMWVGGMVMAGAISTFGLVMLATALYLTLVTWATTPRNVRFACEILADAFPIVYGVLALAYVVMA